MPFQENAAGAGDGAARSDAPPDWFDSRKGYTVMLDSIRSDIETSDSFAIKFSILAKMPLSKVKHMIRRLPARIWSGQGKGRAERILALVQEAGGNGSILEGEPRPAAPAPRASEERPSCGYCGFPLNEGDRRCGFCMTPVGETAGAGKPGAVPASGATDAPRRRFAAVPPKRLLVYAVILVVGILALVALR